MVAELLVAALLFASLVAVGVAVAEATALLEQGDPVETTFEGLTGAVAGVPLAVLAVSAAVAVAVLPSLVLRPTSRGSRRSRSARSPSVRS